jgi:hypothetical protein
MTCLPLCAPRRFELGFEEGYGEGQVVEKRHDYMKSCLFRSEELPFKKPALMLERYLLKADGSLAMFIHDWGQVASLTSARRISAARLYSAQVVRAAYPLPDRLVVAESLSADSNLFASSSSRFAEDRLCRHFLIGVNANIFVHHYPADLYVSYPRRIPSRGAANSSLSKKKRRRSRQLSFSSSLISSGAAAAASRGCRGPQAVERVGQRECLRRAALSGASTIRKLRTWGQN